MLDNTSNINKRNDTVKGYLVVTCGSSLLKKKGNQNDKITLNKEKIEKVLPPELLKRDKKYIEKYIIDAIVQYNSLNKFKTDEINLLDLKV